MRIKTLFSSFTILLSTFFLFFCSCGNDTGEPNNGSDIANYDVILGDVIRDVTGDIIEQKDAAGKVVINDNGLDAVEQSDVVEDILGDVNTDVIEQQDIVAGDISDVSEISDISDTEVDTTPPDTTITLYPSNPSNSPDATFEFECDESGCTFECRLDGSTWSSCTSPKTYTGLSDGIHIFEVRARDSAGNIDSTPASYTWTIDAHHQIHRHQHFWV